jgi:hypothetical protein
MTNPLGTNAPRREQVDLRDLARRSVAAATAIAGLVGIVAGRPLITVISRAGVVCAGGLVLIAAAEAIVRRARRRLVR